MNFVNCKRIPKRGRSLCSSFVLSFSLIVPTKLEHVSSLVCGIQEHTGITLCAHLVHNSASYSSSTQNQLPSESYGSSYISY